MKNDSTVVSEPEAENLFGVNQASALVHYTRHARKRRNAMKESMKDEMFRRFVKDPFRSGVRLDTVMTDGKGSLVYRYSHLMQSFPGLRKIDVSLFGTVFRDGEQVAEMPSPEKLTFYVSSLSSLADNTPRYMFKVVDRIVRDNTAAFLDFSQGSAGLDTLREGNSAELARIRSCFRDVCSREGLVIDSIVVTASCSPEGRWEYNTKLAEARAETVRSYVRDNISGVDDSLLRSRYIPENWEYLKRIVAGDTLISSESKRLVAEIAGMQDKDRAEEELSRLPEFIHIRTRIYPMLRIVDFSFFMHRPDVKKDTVHTMEIDTVYMNGLLALKNLDYKKAASVLSPYKDYNTALALASSGYDDKALDAYQGAQIALFPGRYGIVCWGNALEETTISEGEKIAANGHYDNSTIHTNDPLYYGTVDIEVPETLVEKDYICDFVCSHVKFRVRIEGFDDPVTNVPTLELTQLASFTDFDNIPSEEERCSYYPVLDADPNDATSYTAAFNTLRFKDDNDITLRIHANESRVIAHEFSLADFLDENNIAVEGVHEVTIPILIRFSPIGVEIIDWDTAPVIPDFDKD